MLSHFKTQAAYWLFNRPFPFPLPPRAWPHIREGKAVFKKMLHRQVYLQDRKRFTAYEFNPSGRVSILVTHGWMSQALYMVKIIKHLVEQDYHVVALDLPGHGTAESGFVSLKDSVGALLKTQEYFGPFAHALGHSYGGSMLLNSLTAGDVHPDIRGNLEIKRLVLMASPVKIDTIFELFSSKLFLTDQEKQKFMSWVQADYDRPLELFDCMQIQKQYPRSTFIHCIHDIADHVVPLEDALYLQELGDRVSLSRVSGLGHLRILFDDRVMTKITRFLERDLQTV